MHIAHVVKGSNTVTVVLSLAVMPERHVSSVALVYGSKQNAALQIRFLLCIQKTVLAA